MLVTSYPDVFVEGSYRKDVSFHQTINDPETKSSIMNAIAPSLSESRHDNRVYGPYSANLMLIRTWRPLVVSVIGSVNLRSWFLSVRIIGSLYLD